MKLRYGYLISGAVTGIILLISFIWTLPDGKMHVIFCDVGQGDSAYVRFPDGRDMLIDGGPDDSVIRCLGRHMPFWDRHINLVAMTHPQKDHMQGLISVLERYDVDYFLRSDVANPTDGFATLMNLISSRKIDQKFLVAGDVVSIGSASLSVVWPSSDQIAKNTTSSNVLGATTVEVNDSSLVIALRYGIFDVVFAGDADSHIQPRFTKKDHSDGAIDVLKVPHHGSKTGMTTDFLDWIRPKAAVISVGKNSFGHPSKEAVDILQNMGSTVYRTDKNGDIEAVSDGRVWTIRTGQ